MIDPEVIVYAGYIGGSGSDLGYGIAVDPSGAAYVTGSTGSADFPAIGGPTNNGSGGALVAKVSPDGASLVYAGYIGGVAYGYGIAVDSSGAAYVTGFTGSATDFPATGGPDLSHNGGTHDAFVAKVAPDGASLAYAGYIGGSGEDLGTGIAVDPSGAAYVTGFTSSTTGFPATGGPDLSHNGGDWDAFVAKVAPDGASLAYAGYIGGSGDDLGYGIAVDPSGAAYVTGNTVLTTGFPATDFPATGGPDLSHNGYYDAFVAKVAPGGASLAYAGYIGGSGIDTGYGIAVDPSGAAYVTGFTTSADFPATGGPDLTYNGGSDAFVAKVAPGGASLAYAGYIGGSGSDTGYGIAVDPSGAAYVTGYTVSTTDSGFPATGFPATGGPDLSHNGDIDAFVAKVAPSERTLTERTLTVSKDGSGSGTVTSTPPGIDCGDDCSESFVYGTEVTLSATPAESSTFTGWRGACSGTGECTITMDADKNVTATFTKIPATCARAPEGANVIVGTDGDDTLVGTGDTDFICGADGNDSIAGLGEDDVLDGNVGNDVILGGWGRDSLVGGLGRDRLEGYRGSDRLSGNRTDDELWGGRGKDILLGNRGNDYLRGQAGDDTLYGRRGNDTLSGNFGDDYLHGGFNRDACKGGPGTDSRVSCEM